MESKQLIQKILEELRKVLHHQDEILNSTLASFLAGGHMIFEGPPGTGKTSLAKAFAHLFSLDSKRVQMTADMLPSDLIGFIRLHPSQKEFEFRKGPLFSEVLLVDELNRASPKTQSALLEAMEEKTVTVDGVTYQLPENHFVLATQNPSEQVGVYPLVESQLDRFMVTVPFLSPKSREDEITIYQEKDWEHPKDVIQFQVSTSELQELKKKVSEVFIHPKCFEYLTDLVRRTRELDSRHYGVSVRAGKQMIQFCKAWALMQGRDFVTPRDIHQNASLVFSHRLRSEDYSTQKAEQKIHEVLQQVPLPE